MCESDLDKRLASGQKVPMTLRHSWVPIGLCFITQCVGHQTFDDGSDAVRRRPVAESDAGSPSPAESDEAETPEPATPAIAPEEGEPSALPEPSPEASGEANDAGSAEPVPDEADDAGTIDPLSEVGAGPDADAVDAATASTLELNGSVADTEVRIVVGESIDLTLKTIGGGNYLDPTLSGEGLVFRGVGSPAVVDPGGPTQIYHFEGVEAGTTTVIIPHSVRTPLSFVVVVE